MKKIIFSKQTALPITILCCILLSFACSPTPNASVTPPPINSTIETYVPTSINTLVPTATSTVPPSMTPSPTATPIPLASDLGQVIFSESFDNLEIPFNIWGPGRVESGVLIIEREAGYKSPPETWPFGGVYGITLVSPSTTTVVLFQAKNGATFNIGYHTGTYGEESLRRFSYNSGEGTWDWYYGNPTSSGNYPLKQWRARQANFTTWHFFSIKRSGNGDIEAKIWEKDHPEKMFQYQGNLGPEWGSLELTFFIDYHKGTFLLDEYQDLK